MSTKTDDPIVLAAWKAVQSAHWATTLASSCFDDLGTLFKAIAAAADEHSQAARLAKIGLYLCEDWANLHDSEREQLEPHMTALRASLGVASVPNEGGAK